ncbi:MAG: Ig-like domain-containing protein [Pirellulaceae bacterium]
MASQLSTRSKSSSYETQLRRNRLRRVLLETLERRELLAADLIGLADYQATSTLTAQQQTPLVFGSLADDPTAGYNVTNFLDSQLGSASGDLTSRPWFPLIEESYNQWSQSLQLQSTTTVSGGLIAEGEGGMVAEGEAGGPRLLSVAPNSGDIFTFNNTNRLSEAPTELVFRFDGSSDLDAATLADGIRVTRAGGDGAFGDANDTTLVPGYLGFGDNNRVVVLRFASALQDDLYRVELVGEDNAAQGLTAIKNAAGLKLQTRAIDATPTDLTRDSVDFDLELGAQIVAVVPQPVDRVGGVLTPRRDVIRVYFNNDDLYPSAVTTGAVTPNPTVVDPAFYQLILTKDTVEPGDDRVFAPTSIHYDPASDIAELTFASAVDQLAGPGTYRLRVGSRDAVVSTTNPQTVATLSPADPAGNIGNAMPLGTFSNAFSTVINQSIITTSTAALPLDFPGSMLDPGHRDIKDESHLHSGGDTNPGISQRSYNFAFNRPYGTDAVGRPVNTSITPDQVARVREIFEYYSQLLGIDFVETEASGLTVVVGDMFPNGRTSGPGGVAGVAGGSLAIMDGADAWDNSFGASFFTTAMHEIGHLLGLGHTYDLPPGTIMGTEDALADPNPGLGSTEFYFPGDADVLHGQYMYRPDNRDVDTYSFTIPAGQAGRLTAETIAERLANSSNLDTVLTLMKQKPGGGAEVISSNNDNQSSDSFVSAELTEGTYFISVTGKGNEDFDPVIPNTGSGATSQGDYQLKLDFKPTVAAAGAKFTIEDTSGTALDGDGDGLAGGNFNFWFRTAAPLGVAAAGQPKTIFVDKSFTGPQTGALLGSPAQPINTLDFSKWPAGLLLPGDVLRVTGGAGPLATRPAYEIGRGGVGNAILSDGLTLEVPQGVTMMIEAGAILKLQGSRISTGSLSASINRSMSALQVLGTPSEQVRFTSYRDETQGKDTNPLTTTPGSGDWGGIDFHEDVDRREGLGSYERKGIFLNFVSNADIRYGGGQITVSTPSPTVSPINMSESRPTLINNTIRFSADAAMSADPNSFEETRFSAPRYQLSGNFSPDYSRVGPDIRGNVLLSNSINGLFVKTSTVAGGPLTMLDVAARWDDKDITYVLGENLIIKGTPGGALQENKAPDVSLVQQTGTNGGSLAAGAIVQYRVSAVDLYGAEGVPSAATPAFTLGATASAVQLGGLPKASGDFVSRRLWRSTNGGAFRLVAELDSDTTAYKDIGTTLAGALPAVIPTTVNRARLNARLQIDPGIVVKSIGSRIETGMGAQLIAEGTADRPIIFTSRFDDRYGGGGSFDTNSDGTGSNPGAGNWGGLVTRPFSSMSIDHALIAFGGGVTSVAGGFSGFSAVEVHQADVRLANSRFEVNGSGLGGNVGGNRDGHGPNDASVVFVVGSQPVIINNTFLDNSITNTAVVSINANAMKTTNVTDPGRQTGAVDRARAGIGNMGPLVDGNHLLGNGLNGMRIRGETLTTETVWDDTDIVHVLQSEVIVPDLHSQGGLRLQSHSDESLVVKLGAGAGLTALGRPLDINDRIGGSLQIIGAPGFPVVMTSIQDDSVGAGFDTNGRALVDTNNNGPSVGSPGDWRSVRFEPYANDRNVDSAIELETDQLQDTGTNDVVGNAQSLGALAASLSGGDESLRLGFSLDGSIATPQDLDVYSFSATAGTPVWIDIDRTHGSLDSVVELLDANGRILAQSNNSLAESAGTQNRYVATTGPEPMAAESVSGLDRDPFATANSFLPNVARDFNSVNPLDAGMRVVLPGSVGATNTYYVRVRSSNLAPGDATSKLQNPADERKGLTTGNYRLQVRMQQTDETPGSTVRYADIRYATNGIEARGMAASSPLLGQVAETGASTALGNIGNSDRGSVSVSGFFDDDAVDVYSFSIARDSVQVIDPAEQNFHIGTIFDIDYADGFGRPDTTLWVFDGANRLVLVGTDSNIADDQAAPGQGSDLDDLTRGSAGTRDPFIGASELPSGNYTVVVTNNSRTAVALDQFQQANATNPLIRLEPINSVRRISQDRFEGAPLGETGGPAVQVSFSSIVDDNLVQWTLADLTAYVVRSNGEVKFANPYTGAPEAIISDSSSAIRDVAMSPDGRLVAPVFVSGNQIDSNTGDLLLLNSTGAPNSATVPDGSTVAGNSGLQTFTTQPTDGTTFAVQQRDHNLLDANNPQGDGFQFNGLTFATEDNNELKLFGVGSRGRGELSFNLPEFTGTTVSGILTSSGSVVNVYNTTNVVYKLDPTTGAVINPTGFADRTGTDRVGNHAGTQKVEFGRFLSGTASDGTGPYTSGTVTGLAQIGNFLYAVSDLGEFYRVNIGDGDSAFADDESSVAGATLYIGTKAIKTITDGAVPIQFTGLTRGPRNLEGGRFANMLFATTTDGTIYAINTNGDLQPVFPGYSYKVHSSDRGGLGPEVVGIDFSPLDVNLFHLTDLRGSDAGHGRPEPFDKSQDGAQSGNQSLYFGFETGTPQQQGDWSGLYNVAAYNRTYDLPGGAHGATVSNPIDLRGYSASDLPMLYFNYFLDTENANSDLDDTGRMRDAFRVYGAGEDGEWILLATNNTPEDQGLNRNNHSGNSNIDELDNNINGNRDAFGNPLLTQEAYDGTGWRQIRTSLAAFAGQQNVRLRFEFSTAASFKTGDALRGGVELTAVAGAELESNQGFTVTPIDGVSAVGPRRFEFDMGLVLSLPAGADLTSGVSTLTISGTPVVFSTTDNTGTNVQYSPTDSPVAIASKLANRLLALFPSITGITSDPNRPSVLAIAGLPEGTSAEYAVSPDLSGSILVAHPYTSTNVVKIPVTKRMTAPQVRDAVRTALATTYNDAANMALDPSGALDVWKFNANTIQLYKYTIAGNNSALSVTTERVGDFFGVNPTTRTGGNVSLAHMDERAQNNTGEGLYIDDIVIGFAERGEMAFSSTADNSFAANRQYAKTLYDINQIENGGYQLTVRTAADYGASDKTTGQLGLTRQFNTNDRLSQQVGIEVSTTASGSIPDGATFTLSDGGRPVTFEFDVYSGVAPVIPAVQPGNVAVSIASNATRQEIALAIRNAINSPTVQSLLKISASLAGEMTDGTFVRDVLLTGGTVVQLHGQVTTGTDGSFQFPANTFMTPVKWGVESGFGEDLGDSERTRPQGELLLIGNTITNSLQYGIDVTAGNRDQSAIGGTVGNRPYPGAAIAFPTPNPNQLAAGVVIISNIVANNVAGGIRLQGDAGADAPAQIARLLNNTIYGVAGGDTGILIENNATPTILNNIIANSATGISAPVGTSSVLGANVYQGNGTNTVNVGVGSFPELLAANQPLFVDVNNRRFYLAAGSQAIDSSLEALQERPAIAQVKNAIGLPASPMLAPDLDVTGQRRVDDPAVNSPAGLGGNVFKDRGAVDRSDFLPLNAVILQPQDNDAALLDSDRNTTTIQLTQGTLGYFSILLQDNNGTGPDPATVVAAAIGLTENGRLLTEGVDYVVGYNANSRTVRLTPQAGIWRTDSVYEITFNNLDRFELSTSAGSALSDGDHFSLDDAGGTHVFEFDNNGSANAAGATLVPFETSMSAYEVATRLRAAINTAGLGLVASMKGESAVTVEGATAASATGAGLATTAIGAITDLAGNPLSPNRANGQTQFTIVMPDSVLDFGDAVGLGIPVLKQPSAAGLNNGNGARHVLLPVDVPQLVLGSLVDAEVDGQPTTAANGDDSDRATSVQLETLGSIGGVKIGIGGPTLLAFPAGSAVSGQRFTITDSALHPFAPVTFEFQTNTGAGNVVIPTLAGDTPDQVATKVAAAVQSVLLSGRLSGLIPIASNDRVSLGDSNMYSVNLNAAPALTRIASGNVQLVIPASIATLADGQTMTVQDGSGHSVQFELNNTDPALPATPVASGRIAMDVNLATATASDVAAAFANAIHGQIDARKLALGTPSVGAATVDGVTVAIVGDDEDGVHFGGIFNSLSNAVPVTIVSSGAGLLDAWIDWNRDGDFNDASENLFTTSQPVHQGANVFMVQTPVNAVAGFAAARFRLSTLGGLLPSSVGIGGEVEDYLVEILQGSPPVAVSDSYTTEEDLPGGLNVPRLAAVAGGPSSILTNDTDADIVGPAVVDPGVNLFVHDEDPSTLAMDPVTSTANGTLTLMRDGSFTYIPNTDFNGTDTFVYNATDGRLISRVPTTVTITVNPVNDPPLAVDDVRTRLEDEAIVFAGADLTANDKPHYLGSLTEAGQMLTIDSAAIVTHTISDLGGVAGLAVRIASRPGQGNYGIRVYTSTADLGVGVKPTVSVTPDRIDVVLNSHSTSPSTVNDLIAAINGNAAASALVIATLDAGSGAAVIGNATTSYSPLRVPPRAFKTFSVSNNTLSYTPAAQYNNAIGGPVLIAVTIKDDGTAGLPAGLTATSTLTLNITPVNDSPLFTLPATDSPLEDAGVVTVANFLTGRSPGPTLATDEGSGPAISPANQTVSYRVTALDPSLFYPGNATATPPIPSGLPKIDANGTLTYRLAKDVNRVTPFPAVVVEVVAVDSVVGSGLVVTNSFDSTKVFPAAGMNDTYDGTTLLVSDSAGNSITFELDDTVNLPGVGSTAGVAHTAIGYVAADTVASLNQKIVTAINSATAAGANPWAARAFVDTVTGEIRFANTSSVVISKGASATHTPISPLVVRPTNESLPKTFTITPTAVNDAPEFTLPAIARVNEDQGVVTAAGFVTGIRKGPVTALDESVQAFAPVIVDANPAAFTATGYPTIDSATGDLRFETARNFNAPAGINVTVTFVDNAGTANAGVDRTQKSFTLFVNARNDSPEFDMPTAISAFQEVPDPVGLTTTVDPFITNIKPGPGSAGDEVGQQVTFVATALDPSLFFPGDATANPPIPDGLPRIDANGVLTYRLAVDVNQIVPFPTILVQVVASDDGAIGNGPVVTNRFNPALASPSTPNLYDGSTLSVIDQNGNLVILELDDAGLPGVGATSGLPHIAIPFSSADSQVSLNQKIIAAINSPPAASVLLAGTGPWVAQAFVDAATQEIQFTNSSSVVAAAPAGVSSLDAIFAVRSSNESAPRTFTILPDPINDPPEFTLDTSLLAASYPEDSAAVTIDDFIVDARPGPVTALDELLSQTVQVHSVTSTPGAFAQLGVVVNPVTGKGSLTFKTNQDVNSATHDLTVVVTLKDGNEAVDPDVKFTSKTFTITVDPVNDLPEFSMPVKQITRSEDAGLVSFPGFATNILAGPATAIDETTIPATRQTVHFVRVSNTNDSLFDELPSISASGELTFRTKQDQNGQSIVVMRLMDDGTIPARTPSDAAQSIADQTFTITISPINDAPTFRIAGTAASLEDAGPVVIPGFLADILPGPASATDEAAQTLTVHATPIDPLAFAQFSLTADGTLSYQTRTDANNLNADFRVEVYFTDNGAAAPSPNNNRSVTQTFAIDVTPVNDQPSFLLPQTRVDVIEDAQNGGLPRGATVIPGFATDIQRGPASATDEFSQVLNPFEIVSMVGQEKFSVLPAIDTATGNLTFTTAENANGLAVVVMRLTDQGASSPAPNDNISELQTFTIAIAPINDAPQFTIPTTITVDEDAGSISRPGFATGVRRGPVGSDDENSQLINFSVRALNTALFRTQPAIGVDGTLTFETALNVNSANAQLLVEVTLFDSGLDAPAPNVNHSDTRTFTITVNPVNDAPTTDAFTATTTEDTLTTIQSVDVLVGDKAGPTVDEFSQSLRMTQVQRTSLHGGVIVPNFDPLDASRIVSLSYSPPLNLAGDDTFLYVVTDDGTPERSGTGTITISITPVNDPPAFNRGPDQTVNEDAAPVSVPNWATGIVAGPASAADELASQTVSFTVVADNPAWFSVQPAVSDAGTLTYTLAKDINGSTKVVVTAVDSGPGTGANVNRSAPQTFAINITPVNDPPVFTAGPTVIVNEDSGAYSNPWATGIAAAAGLLTNPPTATDEASQIYDFELIVDRPQLFSVQPQISSAGVLEFTTAKDAFGQALVVATLVDRGPAAPSDSPRSTPVTFTISITPSNDAPVANGDTYTTDEDSVLTVAAPGVLANDTDVDLPNDTLKVAAGTFTSDLGAKVTLNADGSLTYDPNGVATFQQLTQGQTISDTFVYHVLDAAGASSNNATVTIAIRGVNDAPVAVDDRYSIAVGQSRTLDILANDSDVDSTIDPRTIEITSRPGFGTLTVNQTGGVTYTPESGFRGNDVFRYTVKDSTGTVSNEAEVVLVVNSAPVAANDSAFTVKGDPVTINVLSNDRDVDGALDTSSVRIEVSPAPNGSVEVLPTGAIRFTPASGFAGEATFAYSVLDNVGTRSNVATVNVRVQNSRWQNPQNSLDVNADGFVSPIDVLLVINYLNGHGNPILPDSGVVPPPYLDPTGDELVTPNDVLQIINYLNANSQGGRGEGESSGVEYAMPITPQQMVDTVGPGIVQELLAGVVKCWTKSQQRLRWRVLQRRYPTLPYPPSPLIRPAGAMTNCSIC